jgi:hypothetical protein
MQEPTSEAAVEEALPETQAVDETNDSSADTAGIEVVEQGAEDVAGVVDGESTETTMTEDINPETQPQRDFQEAVEVLGIDLDKKGPVIKLFGKMAEKLGITKIIASDIADTEKADLVKDLLIAAQGSSEAGKEKFNEIAALVVDVFHKGVEGVSQHLGESLPDDIKSGVVRLIKALTEGANYNSSGSIRGKESENSADVVSSNDLFKMMREDPVTAVRYLESAAPELKKVGWDMGSEGEKLLMEGRNNVQKAKEALKAVLIGLEGSGINSLADHLNKADHYDRWQEVGGVLAQRLFSKKMISLDAKDALEDLHAGKQRASSHDYFGT